MRTTLFAKDRTLSLARLSLLDKHQADLEQIDDGYRDPRPMPGCGPAVWLVAVVPVILAALGVVHLAATFGPGAWQAAKTALAAMVAIASVLGA